MNAKSLIGPVLAALCMIPAESAFSTACQQGSLDGTRVLTNDCGDGTCGWYEVGSNGTTDLGFGGAQPDTIYFEFYSPDANPPDTGTFDLGLSPNNNYATCDQCILVYQDIGSLTPKKFFQTGGTITIDPNTIPGTAASVGLSWSNVTLAEVTIDQITSESTLVPNGDCYTISKSDTIFDNGFEAP